MNMSGDAGLPLTINRVTPLTLSTCASLIPAKPDNCGTLTDAAADFVGSAADVAVSVTLRSLAGKVTGGV